MNKYKIPNYSKLLSEPLYFICKNCKKNIYQYNEMFMKLDCIFCSNECRFNYFYKK